MPECVLGLNDKLTS